MYEVNATSADEEEIETLHVGGNNEAEAIARAKKFLRSEGEDLRGMKWDAQRLD
jgi:hypothetical protein